MTAFWITRGSYLTRKKMSIRYIKENDREKRKRKVEGEIRERDVRDIERESEREGIEHSRTGCALS